MKKTYVTSMPDHIGAFLKASECFASLGINITRVSYNKAVDSHTLFIDAEGTESQLARADGELNRIGYLPGGDNRTSIVLIEFCLPDVPGSVTEVLRLIHDFRFNISYISSQENGSEYQFFKMGLYVEDPDRLSTFLTEAEKLCRVRVIDYNRSGTVYDNTIFYNTYVDGLAQSMNLSREVREQLLVHVNLAMQTLDETGLSPYRTFDSISNFTQLLAQSAGEQFSPRITTHEITPGTKITLIEPPCGSNTAIIESREKLLFVDSGYACYRDEMRRIFHQLYPDFEERTKTVLVTHADVDHCGLLSLFDEVIVSARSARCLTAEFSGEDGFREKNPLHRPYIHICKILTSYQPVSPEKLRVAWPETEALSQPLTQIGFFDFEELHFEVYEGKGGHLPGEIVLIDYEHHIAFTGDIYINIKEFTVEQARYNQYAPILMTSVDTDPSLCRQEREAVLQRLGTGNWKIFGAHGLCKEYRVHI